MSVLFNFLIKINSRQNDQVIQHFKAATIAVFALLGLPTAAIADLTITPTSNSQNIINQLTGQDISVSNLNITQGLIENQVGIFSGGDSGGAGSTLGIADGVVIVTGTVSTADGPNTSISTTTGGEAGPTDSSLTAIESGTQFDTVSLQFNVVPAGNTLSLEFIFASEEYNEFVCSVFNDAMGIFVNGPGIVGEVNIAKLDRDLANFSINEINGGTAGSFGKTSPTSSAPCNLNNSEFFVDNITNSTNPDETPYTGNFPAPAEVENNYTNVEYDGFTIPLASQLQVQPGQTYTIKVVTADIGDALWDGGVFIDAVNSFNLDYGDAPDTYGTASINGAIQLPGPARHSTGSSVYLGSIPPDAEGNGTPATAPDPADGDDNVGDDDDEDAFDTELTVSSGITSHTISDIPVSNTNTSNQTAQLMGWIDFNQDGDFLDDGEQAVVDVAPNQTTADLSWSGFDETTEGNTYARFRITTDPNITNSPSSVGLALDGEVEDYKVAIASSTPPNSSTDIPFASCQAPDLIAPDGIEDLVFPRGYWAASYYEGRDGAAGGVGNVALSADGTGNVSGEKAFRGEAFWGIGESPVRITLNGSAAANRWDNDETPTSPLFHHPSYTGATWTGLNPHYQIDYRRTVEATGVLEFGGEPDDVVDDNVEVFVNGTRVYAYFPSGGAPNPRPSPTSRATIPVSQDDEVLIRFANLGGIGGLSFDYYTPGVDCSDLPADGVTAPDATDSATAYGNAPHIITSGIQLGAVVDPDASGVLSPDATGDGSDDDGISSFPTLRAGDSDYSIPVDNIIATGTGKLHAWIDFDRDGTLENTEYTSVDVDAGNAVAPLNWTGQNTINATFTFARFRFTSDNSIDANSPTGLASDGEVEDYQIAIASDPNLLLVKRITAINPGQSNEVQFNSFVDDATTDTPTDSDNDPQWPNDDDIYLRGTIELDQNINVVKPGDQVEYTIYFLSNGDSNASNVQVCDVIPDNMSFVTNSYSANSGIALLNSSASGATTTDLSNAADTDQGTFFAANTALPTYTISDGSSANLCQKVDSADNTIEVDADNNINGAVVVELDSLPAAIAPGDPIDSYGFIRFRARVK